ncbi:unnamed protein product [Prorocentrum cordatum]|uniref:Uncharacterized protein n=1 Tax=Prorocentrum cordatum TaxID=2364126 RepID=A0ABN9UIH1_9DINO|nr:unnamed protein product [Polarella glacialis]
MPDTYEPKVAAVAVKDRAHERPEAEAADDLIGIGAVLTNLVSAPSVMTTHVLIAEAFVALGMAIGAEKVMTVGIARLVMGWVAQVLLLALLFLVLRPEAAATFPDEEDHLMPGRRPAWRWSFLVGAVLVLVSLVPPVLHDRPELELIGREIVVVKSSTPPAPASWAYWDRAVGLSAIVVNARKPILKGMQDADTSWKDIVAQAPTGTQVKVSVGLDKNRTTVARGLLLKKAQRELVPLLDRNSFIDGMECAFSSQWKGFLRQGGVFSEFGKRQECSRPTRALQAVAKSTAELAPPDDEAEVVISQHLGVIDIDMLRRCSGGSETVFPRGAKVVSAAIYRKLAGLVAGAAAASLASSVSSRREVGAGTQREISRGERMALDELKIDPRKVDDLTLWSFGFCRAPPFPARDLSRGTLSKWAVPPVALEGLEGPRRMAAAVSSDSSRRALVPTVAGAMHGGPSSGPLFDIAHQPFAKTLETEVERQGAGLARWRADNCGAASLCQTPPPRGHEADLQLGWHFGEDFDILDGLTYQGFEMGPSVTVQGQLTGPLKGWGSRTPAIPDARADGLTVPELHRSRAASVVPYKAQLVPLPIRLILQEMALRKCRFRAPVTWLAKANDFHIDVLGLPKAPSVEAVALAARMRSASDTLLLGEVSNELLAHVVYLDVLAAVMAEAACASAARRGVLVSTTCTMTVGIGPLLVKMHGIKRKTIPARVGFVADSAADGYAQPGFLQPIPPPGYTTIGYVQLPACSALSQQATNEAPLWSFNLPEQVTAYGPQGAGHAGPAASASGLWQPGGGFPGGAADAWQSGGGGGGCLAAPWGPAAPGSPPTAGGAGLPPTARGCALVPPAAGHQGLPPTAGEAGVPGSCYGGSNMQMQMIAGMMPPPTHGTMRSRNKRTKSCC